MTGYDPEAARQRDADREAARYELYHRNRRIIAERLGWPEGALEICERLDRLHPPWRASWEDTMPGTSRWAHPARYAATRSDVCVLGGDAMRQDEIRRHPCVYGETVDQLRAAITAMDARIFEEEERERRFTAWMLARP